MGNSQEPQDFSTSIMPSSLTSVHVAEAAEGLNLYGTASHQVDHSVPLKPGEVGTYTYGAVVQPSPHTSHTRAAVAFDIARRWLLKLGYKVAFACNMTGIDDEILVKVAATGQRWWAHVYYYEREFTEVYNMLSVLPPTAEPRATGYMSDMIDLIQHAFDSGHGYTITDADGKPIDDVYFDVASRSYYGGLTRQGRTSGVDEAAVMTDRMGPSVDVTGADKYNPVDPAGASPDRHDPCDSVLWKVPKDTGPEGARWSTSFGVGHPDWHIECSAMSHRCLGGDFDIHGGGLDLRFPHHENEVAQTRTAGYPSAARWVHSAWVTAKGEKTSKSLGTSLPVSSVSAEHPAWVVRYALDSVQYRSMLGRSDQTLIEAQVVYNRVLNFIGRADVALGGQPSREEVTAVPANNLPTNLVAATSDDVNVPGATTAVFIAIRPGSMLFLQLADHTDSETAKAEMCETLLTVCIVLDILGLDPLAEPRVSTDTADGAADGTAESSKHTVLEALIAERLNARAEARRVKDFARADQIRDALIEAGIAIEDDLQGSTWSLK